MDKILLPLTLLPIAGGFIFASLWEPIRYQMMRSEGQRLYLQSIYYGGILGISIFTIILFADQGLLKVCKSGENCLELYVIWSFLLSIVLAYPLVCFANRFVDEYKCWIKSLDVIEDVLLKAYADDKPIMVTLKNNKVYVGYVEEIIDPRDGKARHWIGVYMLLSGYRDDKSIVHYTVNYARAVSEVYKTSINSISTNLKKNLLIALPINEIASVHRYDPKIDNAVEKNVDKSLNEAQTEKPPDQHRQ